MRRFLSFVKASTVGLAFAGSGHARRRMIMVPGAYFRDETIWRGRMIEFACDLKALFMNWGFGQASCTSRLSCNWKGYQWP